MGFCGPDQEADLFKWHSDELDCFFYAYVEGPLQIYYFLLPFILSPIKWIATNSSDLESLSEGEM